ncbi:oxygen-independent coproporphyrinogen III oxidase [Paracoccus indicus]|uniref:oxygen-independent coproporphyrinogen III oxidase n=1 Tax=Paracoccus indicus TaxID=2079229 RepID=UPI000D37B1B5|nr:oxygen-independent coproporphyrinogen III oxidase [Paracoccus indicus]
MTHDPLHHALLNARAPRYTSYPPADRFTDLVGSDTHQGWLRAIPPGSTLSLYVHVPYCRRLCWFCACRTQGARGDAPLDHYLDHLDHEIAMIRAVLPDDITIGALHLGGGTPTILSPDRLNRLGAMLHAAFPIDAATRVSVEIDPCDCDDARLDALMGMGMNRASIGVQDFDPSVQAAIGRKQSAEGTARMVQGLRARGVNSVNMDLLYGLPHQNGRRLARTLQTVLRMQPDRIALYGYAHVPWMARRQALIPEDALPTAQERLDLSDLARDILLAHDYEPVGIDHFALPDDSLAQASREGRLRRNFQGYTTDQSPILLGIGPSAISRLPQGYVQNITATADWQRAVAQGRLPTARGVRMTLQDHVIAAVIEALMCYGRADLPALASDASLAELCLERAGAALRRYPGAGRLQNGVLSLADLRFARLVAQVFDTGVGPRHDADQRRYSQAS